MNIVGKFLILICIFLSSVFAFGLAGGILGAAFAAAAVVLESSKFIAIKEIAETKDQNKQILLGILCASLIGFSSFASYTAINETVKDQNWKYEQAQKTYVQNLNQFKTDELVYKNEITYQNRLVQNILSQENSIKDQENRVDRNKITDQRIQEQRRILDKMKSEIKTPIAPVEPTEPKTVKLPTWIAIVFAGLIESTSVIFNFFGNRRKPEPELVPEPTKPSSEPQCEPTKTVKVVQKSKPEPKPEVEIEEFNIKKHLNLNNAQRQKLQRELRKRGIDWTEFNSNKSNITKAKEYVGI